MDWNANEKELYEKSRALKMQARELRKARLAREDARRDREIIELKAREAEDRRLTKIEQDRRIRTSLFKIAEALKANDLAIKSPGFPDSKYLDSFVLIDRKSSQEIQIRTMHDGFNWD